MGYAATERYKKLINYIRGCYIRDQRRGLSFPNLGPGGPNFIENYGPRTIFAGTKIPVTCLHRAHDQVTSCLHRVHDQVTSYLHRLHDDVTSCLHRVYDQVIWYTMIR